MISKESKLKSAFEYEKQGKPIRPGDFGRKQLEKSKEVLDTPPGFPRIAVRKLYKPNAPKF